MTKKLVTAAFVLATCFLFASSAMAAGPQLAGSWEVTFFPQPSLQTAGATQCVVFVRDGSQLTLPNSGTWTSTTFSGWSGGWIQIGNDFQWYGFFGSGTGNTSFFGTLPIHATATGLFSDTSNGVTNNLGSIVMKRVSSCTAAAKSSNSDDPTR